MVLATGSEREGIPEFNDKILLEFSKTFWQIMPPTILR
jgi:hypothetical protein